jgi:hypothetical protein
MAKRTHSTSGRLSRTRSKPPTQHPALPSPLTSLREHLAAALKSTGGRPALEGTARRQKIPMSDSDWAMLEELALGFRADGVHVTAGQVGAQLLHEAIARLAGGMPYPDGAVREAAALAVAEGVGVPLARLGHGVPASTLEPAELPNVTVELQTAVGRGGAASRAPGGTRWTVHSIVLHASKAR